MCVCVCLTVCDTQAVDEECFDWEASDGNVPNYLSQDRITCSVFNTVCVFHPRSLLKETRGKMWKWDTVLCNYLG